MSDKTPAVYAALSKARQMAATIAVEYDAKGAGEKIKGRKSSDVYRMLVKVLPACHLEIIPGKVDVVSTEKNGSMTTIVLTQDFHVVSVEDGSMITGGSGGSGTNNSDKFMQIALTYSNKAFILNLLGVVDQAMDESEVYGQELLSEAQLKEFAHALTLVASKPAAWDRIKPKFGTDNPQAFTTAQFPELMDFVSAMPKMTDKLPQAAKDEFFRKITGTGRDVDQVLSSLKFDKETLTYGQKSETAEYMAALKKQEQK